MFPPVFSPRSYNYVYYFYYRQTYGFVFEKKVSDTAWFHIITIDSCCYNCRINIPQIHLLSNCNHIQHSNCKSKMVKCDQFQMATLISSSQSSIINTNTPSLSTQENCLSILLKLFCSNQNLTLFSGLRNHMKSFFLFPWCFSIITKLYVLQLHLFCNKSYTLFCDTHKNLLQLFKINLTLHLYLL